MSSTNLTGLWVGHYWQHGRAHPIHAEFSQTGNQLSGSMRDGETDQEMSVFDVAFEAGLHPGADEQIEASLRELHPESTGRPIRFITHLPEASALTGSIKGSDLEFLKIYQGTSYGGYKVGDALIGQEVENHAVHYRGRLSAEGLEIEGRWWIDPQPDDLGRLNEGSFTLRRSEGKT